jgi:hypothetical protein
VFCVSVCRIRTASGCSNPCNHISSLRSHLTAKITAPELKYKFESMKVFRSVSGGGGGGGYLTSTSSPLNTCDAKKMYED